MKIVITILIFISAVIPVNAQRITREYNNVSLSEALRQLNEQTEEYTISFLYNELEDFRITMNWRTSASRHQYITRPFPMLSAR